MLSGENQNPIVEYTIGCEVSRPRERTHMDSARSGELQKYVSLNHLAYSTPGMYIPLSICVY